MKPHLLRITHLIWEDNTCTTVAQAKATGRLKNDCRLTKTELHNLPLKAVIKHRLTNYTTGAPTPYNQKNLK